MDNKITETDGLINSNSVVVNVEAIMVEDVDTKAKFYNTEDYWPVWIGLVWYFAAIILSVCDLEISHIRTWHDKDILLSFTSANIGGMTILMFCTATSLYIAHNCLGKDKTMWQYCVVLLIVCICNIIGNYEHFKYNGIGSAIWCILSGLLFRTLIGQNRYTAYKFKNMLSLEIFIKIGIVLLAINLKDVAIAGLKGLIVAWVETICLVILIYFIGVLILKVESTESIITACGLSVCGASAAMAVADTIKADKEITSSFIMIMSILTIPWIPTLPLIGNHIKIYNETIFNNDTIGSWIGGFIDSTGAVTASASLGGFEILRMAIVIKMLQNVTIGPIVLGLTVLWYKTYNIKVLWDKFPKFVLGFIFVSIITTILPEQLRDKTINNSFILSESFSRISFVLIGIDIDLCSMKERILTYKKMVFLYIIGQTIDLLTTLGISYVMFTLIR